MILAPPYYRGATLANDTLGYAFVSVYGNLLAVEQAAPSSILAIPVAVIPTFDFLHC